MEDYGLTKSEAINNFVFILGFNALGGFSIFFPKLLTTIGTLPSPLKTRLIAEARKPNKLSFEAARDMELVKSVVYETLRLNPPVPLQFGRARRDMKLSSHEASFDVKKGELLCGYQPLAMRDPRVFEKGEEFVGERFAGEKGKELLKYLFWSNGPQTATPAAGNKQCPAKEHVVETAFLLVAAVFRRYDEFVVDGKSGLVVTGLKRAGADTTGEN